MARKTILTLDDKPYLIPEDQAKGLNAILDNFCQWRRLKSKNYSSMEYVVDGVDATPEIKVSIVSEERITPAPVETE
jgi:hypothetical protein